MKAIFQFVLLLSIIACLCLGNEENKQSGFSRLFKFSEFKLKFNKSYKSLSEELAREKIFLSNALRVFESWISYKESNRSFFLKLNEMSDWSQEEVNNLFIKRKPRNEFYNKRRRVMDEATFVALENQYSKGSKGIDNKKGIEQPEVRGDMNSDNSWGSYFSDSWTTLTNNLFTSNKSKESVKGAIGKTAPDIVYVDHRQTGCLGPVKHQMLCGSCYIISTMALFEYHYCMESGLRASFSDQYVLDCGERVGLKGCSGGDERKVARFNTQFGVERAADYPYQERSYICPYPDNMNVTQMGYLKLTKKDTVIFDIPAENLKRAVKMVPVLIAVGVPDGFEYYGGGVYDGSGCKSDMYHSMVIVGHGREAGQEYWLMRNSLGARFGIEAGHYKISVDAKKECFDDGWGGAILPDVINQTLFETNFDYDGSYIKQRNHDLLYGQVPINPQNGKFNDFLRS